MTHRLPLVVAAVLLATGCGAASQRSTLESYRIVRSDVDPATGQVVHLGVAEDGSGATIRVYADGETMTVVDPRAVRLQQRFEARQRRIARRRHVRRWRRWHRHRRRAWRRHGHGPGCVH